jgi:hypothetical protein
MTTDTQDLILRLYASDAASALTNEAARALEALQAEAAALRMHWETRANFEALQAENAMLRQQKEVMRIEIKELESQADCTDEVMNGLMLEKAHAVMKEQRDAALARLAELEKGPSCGWLTACDEEMIGAHIGVANLSDSYKSAKAKLRSLIDWHIAVATDPAVNGGFSLQAASAGASPVGPMIPFKHGCKWCGKSKCAEGCPGAQTSQTSTNSKEKS